MSSLANSDRNGNTVVHPWTQNVTPLIRQAEPCR